MRENCEGPVNGRILAVTADPAAASLALHVLGERGGFEVVHLDDPVIAIRRIRSERWDLVLADLRLPRMSGLDLAQWASRTRPELPIIVVTDGAARPDEVALLPHHADEVLHKPVPPGQLSTVAAGLIGAARRRSPCLSPGVVHDQAQGPAPAGADHADPVPDGRG